jgi:hypothetical protein
MQGCRMKGGWASNGFLSEAIFDHPLYEGFLFPFKNYVSSSTVINDCII